MTTANSREFLAGIIEGFYGQPWSHNERLGLILRLAGLGLNTYFYAPKDDCHHRLLWRENYGKEDAHKLQEIIRTCRHWNVRFIYALSPGLDIQYEDPAEIGHLKRRFQQMLDLGCEHFALLFDDLPELRHGSAAPAQARVTNALFTWVRQHQPGARFAFCPTAYCGRMAARGVGGNDYLATVGRELLPDIDVFWTGPEIISPEITREHIEEVTSILRRKPLIWDNLHANDYDGRRFFCGPYSGRWPGLPSAASGILINPNCEFPLNEVPMRTLAEFLRGSEAWDPREAYLRAMRHWQSAFTVHGPQLDFEDLVFFGDCYYLPHSEGPTALTFQREARDLLRLGVSSGSREAARVHRQATRLRDICARLADLRDRPLFHALSRRLWELREEMDLLQQYLAFRMDARNDGKPFIPDSHLPGTWQGGIVAKFQRMLLQKENGEVMPAPGEIS